MLPPPNVAQRQGAGKLRPVGGANLGQKSDAHPLDPHLLDKMQMM